GGTEAARRAEDEPPLPREGPPPVRRARHRGDDSRWLSEQQRSDTLAAWVARAIVPTSRTAGGSIRGRTHGASRSSVRQPRSGLGSFGPATASNRSVRGSA